MIFDDSRLWARAGIEPATTAFLSDPIRILLTRAGRLSDREVIALIREARRRRTVRTGTRPAESEGNSARERGARDPVGSGFGSIEPGRHPSSDGSRAVHQAPRI